MKNQISGLVTKIFLTLVGAVCAHTALASGWAPTFKVTRLVAHDTGHLMVYVDPPLAAGFNGCTNTAYFQVSSSNPSFKNIYAALLSAQMTQTTVGGYVGTCTGPVYEGPVLIRVDVLSNSSVPYP